MTRTNRHPTPTPAPTARQLRDAMCDVDFGEELALSEETRRMLELLPRLLDELSPGEDLAISERVLFGGLVRPDAMREWGELPREVLTALLHHVVARARAWSELMGAATRASTRPLVRRLFAELKQLRRQHDLAFIHGMGKKHRPRRAASWRAEAEAWWRELEAEVELPTPPAAPPRAPKPREGGASTPAARELEVPARWPWLAYTRGKRVVLIGGDSRPRCRERLKADLRCRELEWIEQRSGGGSRALQRCSQRIHHGTIDLLIILKRFVGHDITPHIVTPAKACDVRMVWVERGYGIAQIRQAAERHLPRPASGRGEC